MRPYKEITLNTGETKRVFWDEDKARAKHNEIRAQVIAEFNARDCEKAQSLGIGDLIKDGALQTTVPDADTGKWLVHPLASEIKHSGADTTDEVCRRWHEFCSVPQEDDFIVVPQRHEPKRQLARKWYPQVEVKEAKDDGATNRRQEILTDKPRRKPGRPRKVPVGQLSDQRGVADAVPG